MPSSKTWTLLAAVVVLLAFTAVIWSLTPAYAAPDTLQMDDTSQAPPARERLLALAATLPTTSAARPATTHIRLQRWSMDLTDPSTAIVVHDEQVWWLADRSGHAVIDVSGQDPVRVDYGPGEYAPVVPDSEPAADPALLYTQLARHEPPANGPQVMLRAVGDLAETHHLDGAQLRAALMVLANVPGLVWRGETVDRAGRAAMVVSVDTTPDQHFGQTRNVLVLGLDGQILGRETIHLTPPPSSPITANTVTSYMVLLKSEHL